MSSTPGVRAVESLVPTRQSLWKLIPMWVILPLGGGDGSLHNLVTTVNTGKIKIMK